MREHRCGPLRYGSPTLRFEPQARYSRGSERKWTAPTVCRHSRCSHTGKGARPTCAIREPHGCLLGLILGEPDRGCLLLEDIAGYSDYMAGPS